MLVLALTTALAAPAPDTGNHGIVGGTEAVEGRWDHHVVVTRNGEPWCSGLLVARDVVLTAAHCGRELDTVWLQTTDLAEPGTIVPVAYVFPHDDPDETFDVSALVLEAPVDVPVPTLAMNCLLDDTLFPGARARVAGFGATDVDGIDYSDVLLEVELPIVDPACADTTLGCNEAVMPAGELVAGGMGLDSCIGDSGAPLDLQLEDGWAPMALVSRGISGARTCGDGGIYVRLDAIADWVEHTTGRRLQRPDCQVPPLVTVEGEGFVVRPEQVATFDVEVSDPDGGPIEMTLEDVDPRLLASLTDFALVVEALRDPTPGPASLTVVATDPQGLQTRVTRTFQVHRPARLVASTRRGCSSSGVGGASMLLFTALLVRRRRR